MKNFSFVRRLTNERHVHYMQEFVDMIPEGLWQVSKVKIKRLIGDELENLKHCRKNHDRVLWLQKIDQIKANMAALYHILCNEAERGSAADAIEKHSYDRKVKGIRNPHEYVEATNAFILAWQGSNSTAAEELVNEISDLTAQSAELMSQMDISYKAIGNIPAQSTKRAPTDACVYHLILRMEVEIYEANPNVQDELGHMIMVRQLLNGVKNWLMRIAWSVKNSKLEGKEDEDEDKDKPSQSDKEKPTDSTTDAFTDEDSDEDENSDNNENNSDENNQNTDENSDENSDNQENNSNEGNQNNENNENNSNENNSENQENSEG